MKTFVTIVFSIILIDIGFAQVPYYDALTLRTHYNPATNTISPENEAGAIEVNSIIKFYGYQGNNPFLDSLFDEGGLSGLGSFAAKSLTGYINPIGGVDVTNVADGLAKFIVERAKEELTITFFERFKEDLDSLTEIRILFPTTYKTLKVIDHEIYNFAAYLDLIRESLKKDLITILSNVRVLINDPVVAPFFNNNPYLKTILSDALFMANELNKGLHPGEAIHNYISYEANEKNLELINQHIYPGLKTFDIFSSSLRSKQADKFWINTDSLHILFKDDVLFNLYFGLIYEQAKDESIKFNGKLFTKFLEEGANNLDSIKSLFQPYLVNLIDRGRSVDQAVKIIRDLKKQENEKPTYEDYFAVYNASLNFLEYATQFHVLFNLPDPLSPGSKVEKYFSTMRSVGNVYMDVNQKQYASAVVEFASIYDNIFIKGNESDETRQNRQQIMRAFIKYGNFAAIMTKAETSDEVKKAIEAVALPSGSARIKRETKFNASINAFVGPYIGSENIPINEKHNYKLATGLSAPIGVALSWGINPRSIGRKGDSFSFFFSLIDIGALTSFRFQDDSTETAPQIKLEHIFSPGIFLIYGIHKTPISISLGNQLGPRLHKVTAEEASNVGSFYHRVSLSLFVDIPLMNLSSKPLNRSSK